MATGHYIIIHAYYRDLNCLTNAVKPHLHIYFYLEVQNLNFNMLAQSMVIIQVTQLHYYDFLHSHNPQSVQIVLPVNSS